MRLREVRQSKGYMQKQVAFALGVSRPVISEWESGRKNPSTENLMKLAKFYNVTLEQLTGISKEEEPLPIGAALDDEIASIILSLDQTERMRVMAYIEGLKANRKG